MKHSNLYMVRGTMTVPVEPNEIELFYQYNECGYNDVYIQHMKNDPNCTEIRIIKCIDNDHQNMYMSTDAGNLIPIAPRDFTNIRSRWKMNNCMVHNENYKKIVGTLLYAVGDNHPFNVKVKEKHIRGKIIHFGFILSQTEEQENKKQMNVCYVVAVDLCGLIPGWIVNKAVLSKGMQIKRFPKFWNEEMTTILKNREQNGWKKNHQPLYSYKS